MMKFQEPFKPQRRPVSLVASLVISGLGTALMVASWMDFHQIIQGLFWVCALLLVLANLPLLIRVVESDAPKILRGVAAFGVFLPLIIWLGPVVMGVSWQVGEHLRDALFR